MSTQSKTLQNLLAPRTGGRASTYPDMTPAESGEFDPSSEMPRTKDMPVDCSISLVNLKAKNTNTHSKQNSGYFACDPLSGSNTPQKCNSTPCLWLWVGLLVSLNIATLIFYAQLHTKLVTQTDSIDALRKDYEHHCQNIAANNGDEERSDFSSLQSELQYTASTHPASFQKNGIPSKVASPVDSPGPSRFKRNANQREYTQAEAQRIQEWRLFIQSEIATYHEEMPKVHLRGLDSQDTELMDENDYLLWQKDRSSFHARGVTLKYVHHQSEKVSAIEINRQGVFLIYSQVIINGTNSDPPTYRHDCTHETVAVHPHHRHHRQTRVLMSSYLTQDGQGLIYNTSHSSSYPKDSALQIGLFYLSRGDQVKVRMSDAADGGSCRAVNVATDMHASYLGLFRVS